ncbi:MAG TPA: choice-of-anchor D domain-containing protein [Candidatus Baltobacteraceae bacterium]|nr:choice-of-anchor D domain-containing protein [Candidatus Baltobacteraceae bacterium]
MRIFQRIQLQAARAAIFAALLGVSGAVAHAAPSILSQPASRTVTVGQTATFTVKALGEIPLSFQWYVNGSAISGAKSYTYTTPATTSAYNGAKYTVVIKDGTGTTTSAAAVLTVDAASAAVLSSSSTGLVFGSIDVSTTGNINLTLKNTGNATATISSVTVSGAGFSASGLSAGTILQSGQSVTFDAAFDPAASGVSSGSITIKSNATNSPTVISLSGTGVAQTSYSVSLSWAPSASSVVGYNVYSGTVSGGPYTKLTSSPVDATSYTDKSVQSGQTYYFVVTAVNSEKQESAYSKQASAVIP